MDLQVQIKPEDIEQAIVQAVLDTSLGKTIKEIAQKEIDDFGKSYMQRDGAIARAVKQEINQMVINTIRDEYSDLIKGIIKEKISTQVVEKFIGDAWEKLVGGYY